MDARDTRLGRLGMRCDWFCLAIRRLRPPSVHADLILRGKDIGHEKREMEQSVLSHSLTVFERLRLQRLSIDEA